MHWRAAVAAFFTAVFGIVDAGHAESTSRRLFSLPPVRLPDLFLNDLRGQRVDVRGLAGHPLFVNLWATWCTPCRAEMPDLDRLYRANRERGFEVIGINEGDSKERTQRFVRQVPVTYRILLDPDSGVSDSYGFDELPVTLVVDRRGVVVHAVIGLMEAQRMQAELQIAEGAPAR